MQILKFIFICFISNLSFVGISSAEVVYTDQQKLHQIVKQVSAKNIEKTITKLVGFGTRHTLSETKSNTRGIGAARRWIKSEFEEISKQCNGCLNVYFQKAIISGQKRIPNPTEIVSVIAILKGKIDPERYVIMSGDIDSRVTDPMNSKSDSPGANDNASGVAGILEAARVLSKYEFSPKGGQILPPIANVNVEAALVVAISNEGRMLAFPLSELPELARGKGNRIINIPTSRLQAREEFMLTIAVVAEGQSLVIYSGKRHHNLKLADLQHYIGERGRRGNKLPRGFQKVDRVEVSVA